MEMVNLALYLLFELGGTRLGAGGDINNEKVSALCQVKGERGSIRGYLSLANKRTV
jgi:hypothetical protein